SLSKRLTKGGLVSVCLMNWRAARSEAASNPPATAVQKKKGWKVAKPVQVAAAASNFASPPPKTLAWNRKKPTPSTARPNTKCQPISCSGMPSASAKAANTTISATETQLGIV